MLTALKNQLEKIDNKLYQLIESYDEYKIKLTLFTAFLVSEKLFRLI
jgi:hypothetical protein